jgi:hypothetical protein
LTLLLHKDFGVVHAIARTTNTNHFYVALSVGKNFTHKFSLCRE